MPKTITYYVHTITYSCGHRQELRLYSGEQDKSTSSIGVCGDCHETELRRKIRAGGVLFDDFKAGLSPEQQSQLDAFIESLEADAEERARRDRW